MEGDSEGSFFSDDADEVAKHCALGDGGLVGGVEGFEDVVLSIVGEEFDGGLVFEAAEEDDLSDAWDVCPLEDAGISWLEEWHHGIGGDSACEPSFGVSHFGGYEFEGF